MLHAMCVCHRALCDLRIGYWALEAGFFMVFLDKCFINLLVNDTHCKLLKFVGVHLDLVIESSQSIQIAFEFGQYGLGTNKVRTNLIYIQVARSPCCFTSRAFQGTVTT